MEVKRSRAVLLPTPGDPILLYYWLKVYETVWRDEIDKLYICINGQTDQEVLDFELDICKAVTNAEVITYDTMIDHGRAVNELLSICKEKYVMLIEDDGFIFRKGKVDQCFKKLESGDYEIVGSKRGSCSQEILDKAANKWGLDYSGFGDSGCNFWPNFVFTTRELLLKTDREFGARRWEPGELIDGLNMEAEFECVGDTFVNTSLQLRALVPDNKIWYEQQYHGATDDSNDYINLHNIWNVDAAWLHVGSLSSGIYGLLDLQKDLDKSHFQTDNEKLELERRVVFWSIFAENFVEENAIQKQLADYKSAIARLIKEFNLSPKRIEERKKWYYEVLPRWTR